MINGRKREDGGAKGRKKESKERYVVDTYMDLTD